MRSIYLFPASAVLVLVLNYSLFAQKNKEKEDATIVPEMPVNADTKLITYTEVVLCDGTQQELYDKALAWYKKFYKNPTDVIRKQDPENGMIQGIARYKIFNKHKKGVDTDAGNVSYTILVYVKDKRYKYELTKFNWLQTSSIPIEKWQDKSSKLYSVQYEQYLIQTDAYAKDLIEKLKNHMGSNPVEDNKDKW
ncbi:MAG: DUF4468 domain-containing protein [Bacteroidetes bacterium]|nr:DUF4468 domain-containing protein [Bacteroidota bacterium]